MQFLHALQKATVDLTRDRVGISRGVVNIGLEKFLGFVSRHDAAIGRNQQPQNAWKRGDMF